MERHTPILYLLEIATFIVAIAAKGNYVQDPVLRHALKYQNTEHEFGEHDKYDSELVVSRNGRQDPSIINAGQADQTGVDTRNWIRIPCTDSTVCKNSGTPYQHCGNEGVCTGCWDDWDETWPTWFPNDCSMIRPTTAPIRCSTITGWGVSCYTTTWDTVMGWLVGNGGDTCKAKINEYPPAAILQHHIHWYCRDSCLKCLNGAWSQWYQWQTCSQTCGGGTRNRWRACDNPVPTADGSWCDPNQAAESEDCNTNIHCPVDGNWGAYTAWSDCTESCGGGVQNRTRQCNNPPPQHNGLDCASNPAGGVEYMNNGTKEEMFNQTCNTHHCPIDGNWAAWSNWTDCIGECGDGTQNRTRLCNDPMPQYGGANCTGNVTLMDLGLNNGTQEQLENRTCTLDPCPIDGEWGAWGGWTDCTVTCDGGESVRTRLCDDPLPQYGGDNCTSNQTMVEQVLNNGTIEQKENKTCNVNPCPVNGNWSLWGTWSTCTKTCDNGTYTRTRLCDNPAPAYGGINCTALNGDNVTSEQETAACNTHNCSDLSICNPINQDFRAGLGKCGVAWGRCNIYYDTLCDTTTSATPYCDITTSTCHNDVAKKIAQNDDGFDYEPSSTCKLPCGNITGSYVTNINACAATGGTAEGRNDPKKCWEVCTAKHIINGIQVGGIVWKQGVCGCVPVTLLGKCDNSSSSSDYAHYELHGTNCVLP